MMQRTSTTFNLCRTCSLNYRSFFIPTSNVTFQQPYIRSYSQSEQPQPQHEQQENNNNEQPESLDKQNMKTTNDPLGDVLDIELDAIIYGNKKSRTHKPQSESARDFKSLLDTLWPETEIGPALTSVIPQKSTATTTTTTSSFQPNDPNVDKKTKRIQSQIEKQLLAMVRKSQKPHKKTSPLPRGMLGSFYGKSLYEKARRPVNDPMMVMNTGDKNIAARDKETNAINIILECGSSRELLEHVIHFTAPTISSTTKGKTGIATYPSYYPKLLTRSIEQAGMTFQDPYLALSIFEHAKNHSVMSYVYGCTTEVYNAMLTMRWKLWQDVHGMLNLVEEMMANGVDYDNETRQIVQMVVLEVENEMLSDHPQEEKDFHSIKDGMIWSMDERRSANIMKALIGKWLIK
ncbi:hypothetical protein BDC45DRAFT_527915 [Circinella umbellata]|nr:hypothetical protein BDC45DRAFT_527915 [Circinella umbellata]